VRISRDSRIGPSHPASRSQHIELLTFQLPAAERRDVDLIDQLGRVIRHIAAQAASVVGLHRLGEELADAREVSSFHRLSTFVLHDLKNLVAQQSFVLENARQFRDNPVFVSDAMAAFDDSTNRMRALIAKLRSPTPDARPGDGWCDLLDVLRTLVASSKLAARQGCTVHIAVPRGIDGCMAVIDRSAAAQLFGNLLVNALESLPSRGGTVTVSIQRLDRAWQVAVQDDGHGIPETFVREHLFRPFHTTKATGLGIGLYQCKTIVESVGGSIDVDSREHVGTTVTVTLRAHADANSAVSPALAKRPTSHLDRHART
jgi:putative PEP-CTERM system histidine kinase